MARGPETPEERELAKLLKEREDPAEAQEAIKRARKGDESALPAVRRYLDARGPEFLDVVDLARIARETQIERALGEDLAAREALARKLELMRREILGPDPSVLEDLLADRIILCWLQLYYAEIKHAEQSKAAVIPWTQDDWNEKRLDRLQRRYLAAIKGLAQVRKLLRPGVQINLADKQVNVAGDLKH